MLRGIGVLLTDPIAKRERPAYAYIVQHCLFCLQSIQISLRLTIAAKCLTTCALKSRPRAGCAVDGFNALQLVLGLVLLFSHSNQIGSTTEYWDKTQGHYLEGEVDRLLAAIGGTFPSH